MSRAEVAYEAIKKDIVEWRLQPGDALSEAQLAEEVGASRTPVREALQRLGREGLVKLVPGRGAFVSVVSVADVTEIFQLREMLEALAARLAASHGGPSAGVAITGLIASFEKFQQEQSDFDRSAYYELTREMDLTVLRLGGNRRLSVLLDGIGAESRRLRHFASSDTDRLIASAGEHIEILQAIANGEADEAERAAREHVRSSRDHVVAGLWRQTA